MHYAITINSLRSVFIHIPLALLVMVSGCAAPKNNALSSATINTISGTRVIFREKCVRTQQPEYEAATRTSDGKELGFLAQLATALVPSLVNRAVSFAASYAEQAGKEYSATSMASTSSVIMDNAVRGCIMYVVGTFGNQPSTLPESGWSSSQLNEFGLAHRPSVYAEFVLHSIDGDGKYAAITPVFLDYNVSQAKRTSAAGIKELSFIIELATPENTTAGSSILTTGNVIAPPAAKPSGNVAVPPTAKPPNGTFAPYTVPPAIATNPIAIANENSDSKNNSSKSNVVASYSISFGKVSIGSTLESKALKGLTTRFQLLDRSNRYLNLSVATVETEKGGNFLLALAAFLEESKKPIVDTSQSFLMKLISSDATSVPNK